MFPKLDKYQFLVIAFATVGLLDSNGGLPGFVHAAPAFLTICVATLGAAFIPPRNSR
jgi:hypothetical protein